MRRFRVYCNSIATRERFERALQAQGFRTINDKKTFDRIKLLHINPDSVIYYIIWADNTYTIGDASKYLLGIFDDIDCIDGRRVTSKAKQLRQQVDKLKEEQQ